MLKLLYQKALRSSVEISNNLLPEYPLHAAFKENRLEDCKALIENGYDINLILTHKVIINSPQVACPVIFYNLSKSFAIQAPHLICVL
jgi:hypothetical protein